LKQETSVCIDIGGACSLSEIPDDCDDLLNAMQFRLICPGFWLSARSSEYLFKHIQTSHDNTAWILDTSQGSGTIAYDFIQNRKNQISAEVNADVSSAVDRSFISKLHEAPIGRGFLCAYAHSGNEKADATFVIVSDRLASQRIYYFYYKDILFWSTVFPRLMDVKREFCGPVTLNQSELCGYLQYLHHTEDRTMVEGIYALPPAACLSLSRKGPKVSVYWRPSFDSPAESDSNMGIRLRNLICGPSFSSMLSNGSQPGVLLSGGMDSSLITALLKKSVNDVFTYAVGFKGEPDERGDAQFVADHFQTRHRTVIIAPGDVEALLWDTVRALGFPSGNPSALATYRVVQQARDEVGRLLSGLGCDELFAGHTKHIAARYWPVARYLISLANGISYFSSGKNGNGPWIPGDIQNYIDFYTYFNEAQLYQILTDRDNYDFRESFTVFRTKNFYQSLFLIDVFAWLSDGLLPIAGTLAASQNLSFEMPLCSDSMLEFAAKVPYHLKVRGFTGKWILRKAVADILPGSIFDKRRCGFTMPMGRWLKGPLQSLLHEYLNEKIVARRGLFRPEVVESMVQTHLRGKRDLSLQLWALITLEIWQQIFLDKI
jgi:asparagine synthase (glutamine-hydrolysing)